MTLLNLVVLAGSLTVARGVTLQPQNATSITFDLDPAMQEAPHSVRPRKGRPRARSRREGFFVRILRRLGHTAMKQVHELRDESGPLRAAAVADLRVPWPEAWKDKLLPESEFLGEGAFGTVLLATLTCNTASKVAVKLMRFEHDNNESVKEQIQEARKDVHGEAAVMRALSVYPQFLAYFDFQTREDTDSITDYIMMEWAEGGDLKAILPKATERRKHGLFYDVLTGIKAMHEKNIIHRDLKPENIFISKKCSAAGDEQPCSAKIGDLGIACRLAEDKPPTDVPVCGEYAGSENHRAPETYAAAQSPASDMWALGIILYKMTFRYPPESYWECRTEAEWKKAITGFIITEDTEFQSLGKDIVGRTVRRLLTGMLQVEPEKRMPAKEALRLAKSLVKDDFKTLKYPAPDKSLPACFWGPQEKRPFCDAFKPYKADMSKNVRDRLGNYEKSDDFCKDDWAKYWFCDRYLKEGEEGLKHVCHWRKSFLRLLGRIKATGHCDKYRPDADMPKRVEKKLGSYDEIQCEDEWGKYSFCVACLEDGGDEGLEHVCDWEASKKLFECLGKGNGWLKNLREDYIFPWDDAAWEDAYFERFREEGDEMAA